MKKLLQIANQENLFLVQRDSRYFLTDRPSRTDTVVYAPDTHDYTWLKEELFGDEPLTPEEQAIVDDPSFEVLLIGCPEITKRRLLDDGFPEGYLESDKEFVRNNIKACVWFLEKMGG